TRGLQHIGTARRTGNTTVTVLGHPATGGSHHKGASGRDVEQVGTVTAGTAGIHHILNINIHWGRQLTHDLSGTGNFIQGFTFHPQGDEKTADLGRCSHAGHHVPHYHGHLFG